MGEKVNKLACIFYSKKENKLSGRYSGWQPKKKEQSDVRSFVGMKLICSTSARFVVAVVV